jgi:pilus assembly protein Flp/PilA
MFSRIIMRCKERRELLGNRFSAFDCLGIRDLGLSVDRKRAAESGSRSPLSCVIHRELQHVAASCPSSIAAGHFHLKEESVMQVLTSKIRRFLVSEDGPTAVEYAVMLALVIVAAISAITGLKNALTGSLNSTATALNGTATTATP